jgi:hypothetical protein
MAKVILWDHRYGDDAGDVHPSQLVVVHFHFSGRRCEGGCRLYQRCDNIGESLRGDRIGYSSLLQINFRHLARGGRGRGDLVTMWRAGSLREEDGTGVDAKRINPEGFGTGSGVNGCWLWLNIQRNGSTNGVTAPFDGATQLMELCFKEAERAELARLCLPPAPVQQQEPVVLAGSADEVRANVRRLLPGDGSNRNVGQLALEYAEHFGGEELHDACQRFGFVAAGNRGNPRSLLESMDGVEAVSMNAWRIAGADETKEQGVGGGGAGAVGAAGGGGGDAAAGGGNAVASADSQ